MDTRRQRAAQKRAMKMQIGEAHNRLSGHRGPLGVIAGKFTLSFWRDVRVPRRVQSRMSDKALTSPNDAMRYNSEQSKTSP